jgi:hypothetical protein
MIEGNFEPHFALKHMLKDMKIASQLGLSHHLELAVTTASRDRLLEQEQRGYAEEDFSVIARKYFPEMALPTVDQDLELFEKPPPIEPAATISSMGEVAAAVQDVDLTPPAPEPVPVPEPQPATEELIPAAPSVESAQSAVETAQTAVETNPAEPQTQAIVSSEKESSQPQPEEPNESKSPMDMLAKLLRGESARPDES